MIFNDSRWWKGVFIFYNESFGSGIDWTSKADEFVTAKELRRLFSKNSSKITLMISLQLYLNSLGLETGMACVTIRFCRICSVSKVMCRYFFSCFYLSVLSSRNYWYWGYQKNLVSKPIFKFWTLYAPTPQNGQTHWNNSSVTVNELFEFA